MARTCFTDFGCKKRWVVTSSTYGFLVTLKIIFTEQKF